MIKRIGLLTSGGDCQALNATMRGVVKGLTNSVDELDQISESLPVDGSYFLTLIKMMGITYIGQFSSGICKDAGYQATGVQIELFCRLSVLVLCIPVLMALLETVESFLI